MSKRLTCQEGHQWEPPPASASTTLGGPERCPVCGGLAEERNGAAPETTLFAQPRLPALDDSPPTLPGTEDAALDTGPQELPSVVGYEIIEELGRGGMGVVYKARQLGLNRLVALKMILAGAHAGPKSLGRFRSEAEAVARLQHPNIVQIYEVGEQEGRPYFSLEYVDGGSLAKVLTGVPLPAQTSAQLIETLARAIHVAHQRGIIHRDLKPANILLSAERGARSAELNADDPALRTPRSAFRVPGSSALRALDCAPKITDFGLAKQLESASALSHSGGVVGTPSYMAPEQAGGRASEVGPSADVYSLGAILYELLTGRPPFRGETALDTMLQVLSEDPVPPRRLQSKVPPDLETICLKCLEKEPQRRYPTALELADELRRFLDHEPIHARPISYMARGLRWCRRNPVLAAVSGLAGLALLAVVALSIGFGILQNRAAARLQVAKRHTEDALREVSEQKAQLEITDANRRRFERMSASLALDQGLRLCEQDEVQRGMLWLARSLEIAPADAADLQRAIRANLDRWRGRMHALKNYLEHAGPVLAVAFSSDGKLVLTGSEDGTARLWDAATGRPLDLVFRHDKNITSVAFSPNNQLIVTGSMDRTARLWDVGTGKQVGTSLPHNAVVSGVAFSPNGKRVATACYDDTAQVWDVGTGKPIGAPLKHTNFVTAVAFSPNGQKLLTGSVDKAAQLWDVATGQPIGKPMQHPDSVMAVAFSPDGAKIVTGAGRTSRAAHLWDAITCEPIGKLLQHRDRVAAVAFSADSKTVLTGSWDKTARLWDATTGEPIGKPLAHRGDVRGVAFSSDGLTFVTGCSDKTARLWEAALDRPTRPLLALKAMVTGVAFSADGKTVLTSDYDNHARLWDAATGRLRLPVIKHDFAVTAVALSPDGKTILTGTNDVWAMLWDATTGKQLDFKLKHENAVAAVAFSPNGKLILTGGWDTKVRMWDAATGRALVEPIKLTDKVTALAFSPDGTKFLVGCEDKNLGAQLYDTGTAQPSGKPLAHPESVLAVAFSPDGKTLLTGCQDRTARLWDASTCKQVGLPLIHQGAVAAVAFSPDGHVVLTGADDNTARFWEAGSGKPIGPPLQHHNRVGAVAFSRDGKVVVTGSDDKTARLWDAPTLRTGDLEQIVLATQLSTGMELDPNGIVHELDVSTWRECRRRLAFGAAPPAADEIP